MLRETPFLVVVQSIQHTLRILGNLTRQRDESARENPRSKGVLKGIENVEGKRNDKKESKM